LEVPNVLVCDYDKAFDVADVGGVADPNSVRFKQSIDQLPHLRAGNKFVKLDHENDTDPTTDSSAIKMYRTIYIEPPPNKLSGFPAPTLFTSGSICVCGEGAVGYIPYSVSGQQIPNTKYMLGRGPTLGDRSHDNDGLLMTKQMLTGDPQVLRVHKVHISPDPTDPVILIESRRHVQGDFMKFVNRGPDETGVTEQNTMFSIDHRGYISSIQIDHIDNNAESSLLQVQELAGRVETNANNISDDTARIDSLDDRLTSIEEQLRHLNQ
jgi:hypothetical protein